MYALFRGFCLQTLSCSGQTSHSERLQTVCWIYYNRSKSLLHEQRFCGINWDSWDYRSTPVNMQVSQKCLGIQGKPNKYVICLLSNTFPPEGRTSKWDSDAFAELPCKLLSYDSPHTHTRTGLYLHNISPSLIYFQSPDSTVIKTLGDWKPLNLKCSLKYALIFRKHPIQQEWHLDYITALLRFICSVWFNIQHLRVPVNTCHPLELHFGGKRYLEIAL